MAATSMTQASNLARQKIVDTAAAVVLACILAGALYAWFSTPRYDDPFITYRYAENLAAGNGFVYNPGERVLSTTTPLFALLLSALRWTTPNLPELGNLIGATSLAAGGLLLWDLARTLGRPRAGWVALMLYPTFSLPVTTLGSETPLYLALCLAAFAAYARSRYTLAALAAALACLARPDGILAAAVLGAAYLLKTRRAHPDWKQAQFWRGQPWLAVAVFALVGLAWFGFAWAYFGSPLPVTLAAKQHQGTMAISERFFEGFFTILRWYRAWPYLLEALVAAAGAALVLARREWRWLPVLGWTVVYFVAYSLLGVSRYFWYYAPLVPGFILALGLGIDFIAGLGSPRPGNEWGRRLAALAAGGVTVLLLAYQVSGLQDLSQQPDARIAAYQAAGEWLAANTEPSDTVGALEVGALGYYARRPVVDFAGLIQPEVSAQFTQDTTYEDAAVWTVERYQPNYVVVHRGVFPRLEQGSLADFCQEAQVFGGEAYQYNYDLVLYRCWWR